jgi:hypothetical protein
MSGVCDSFKGACPCLWRNVQLTCVPVHGFYLRPSDLQAEEGPWNYVPVGGNLCSGRKTAFIPDALVFLEKTPARIGNVNIKVCEFWGLPD